MPSADLTSLTATAMRVWSHPTWDLVLLLVLFAGGFFYGVSARKQRVTATLTYTYLALLLFTALPLAWRSRLEEQFLYSIGVYTIIFLGLCVVLGTKHRLFGRAGHWWQSIVLSFAQVALLIHIYLGFLPADRAALLAPLTKYIFANPSLHFWWLLGPLALTAVVRRLNSRED